MPHFGRHFSPMYIEISGFGDVAIAMPRDFEMSRSSGFRYPDVSRLRRYGASRFRRLRCWGFEAPIPYFRYFAIPGLCAVDVSGYRDFASFRSRVPRDADGPAHRRPDFSRFRDPDALRSDSPISQPSEISTFRYSDVSIFRDFDDPAFLNFDASIFRAFR